MKNVVKSTSHHSQWCEIPFWWNCWVSFVKTCITYLLNLKYEDEKRVNHYMKKWYWLPMKLIKLNQIKKLQLICNCKPFCRQFGKDLTKFSWNQPYTVEIMESYSHQDKIRETNINLVLNGLISRNFCYSHLNIWKTWAVGFTIFSPIMYTTKFLEFSHVNLNHLNVLFCINFTKILQKIWLLV